MLVKCNEGCFLNSGTTDAKLDVDTGKPVCQYCGENIVNLSEYTLASMRSMGDVVDRSLQEAFVFNCKSCKLSVRAVNIEGELVGRGCSSGECDIDITPIMEEAVRMYGDNNDF